MLEKFDEKELNIGNNYTIYNNRGTSMSVNKLISTILNNKRYRIDAVGVCGKGKVRENNEDNFYFLSDYLPLEHEGTVGFANGSFSTDTIDVLGVFDGMGGESSGELASFTAVESFSKLIDFQRIDDEYLTRILNRINEIVCETAEKKKILQMGTTVSLLFFRKTEVIAANLGDSPMYLLRKGHLEKIFLPHTNEKWLKENNINRKPALTQFLGLDCDGMMLEPYIVNFEMKKNDIFLLCSDGLTDMVVERDIEKILVNSKTVEEKAKMLLHCALENGGKDNITIIVCEVKEDK